MGMNRHDISVCVRWNIYMLFAAFNMLGLDTKIHPASGGITLEGWSASNSHCYSVCDERLAAKATQYFAAINSPIHFKCAMNQCIKPFVGATGALSMWPFIHAEPMYCYSKKILVGFDSKTA